MKPDTYTKVVLTIIAACLLIQVVESVTFGQLGIDIPDPSLHLEQKNRGLNQLSR